MKASVKVMRSFDYCHFEVALSSDEEMSIDDVNEMRKQAAILVDEAVRQYKDAKQAERNRESHQFGRERAMEELKRLREIPKSDLSVEQAAKLRSYEDRDFWKQYDADDYWYDDPERDHHFSMLRRFKDSLISPV